MDHVVVIDDMDAMAVDATPVFSKNGTRMSYDEGAAEKRLDPVIVEVNSQTPTAKNGGRSGVTARWTRRF
jgi:hypothetical protein